MKERDGQAYLSIIAAEMDGNKAEDEGVEDERMKGDDEAK